MSNEAYTTDGDTSTEEQQQTSTNETGTVGSGSRRRRGVFASFAFAFLICALLVYAGIAEGGPFILAAYTRVLDVLIDAGIVAYTDHQMGIMNEIGLIDGLPDLNYYFYAQEPLHWNVLAAVAFIYFCFYMMKMVQFHAIGRLFGMKGGFGAHSRAYIYGLGMHRILPYGGGDVAVVSALIGQGEDPKKAESTISLQDRFVWFEIVSFTMIGIVLSGWLFTFQQLFWPVAFLGVLYFITRGLRHYPGHAPLMGPITSFGQIFSALATRPMLLVQLCCLSLFAFFLDDITPFLVSQALTSGQVYLLIPFLIIQGGVVGGYLATRIPITPAGIGQYEFGFCMALDAVGFGFDATMAIVLVDGLFRHGIPILLFAIARVWHGIETSLPEVLDRMAGEQATA